jgi:hypothetical protein
LPETVEQVTGGGGRQFFFEHSGEMTNKVKFAPGLDTRSDGGLVVVPPSLHVSGQRYRWQSPPDQVALAKCPEWLLKEIAASQPVVNGLGRNENGWVVTALEGVDQGQRDAMGIKLCGYFFEKRLEAKEILAILNLWNEKNEPPMSEAQVEKIVRSGSRWENPIQDQGHGRIRVNYIGTG